LFFVSSHKCLLKQNWALTAILLEFRLFAPNTPLYDVNRVFIERFDVSLVTFPDDLPEWLAFELEMEEEELREGARRQSSSGTSLSCHEKDEFEEERRGTKEEQEDMFFYYTSGRVPLASRHVAKEQLLMKVLNEDD
jgi:hypothetical protein